MVHQPHEVSPATQEEGLESQFIRQPQLRTDRAKTLGKPLTAQERYDLNWYKKELAALEKLPKRKQDQRNQKRMFDLKKYINDLESRNVPAAPLARKEVNLEQAWNEPPKKVAVVDRRGNNLGERDIDFGLNELGERDINSGLDNIRKNLRFRQPVGLEHSRTHQLAQKQKQLKASLGVPASKRDQKGVNQLRDEIAMMEDDRDSANARYSYGQEQDELNRGVGEDKASKQSLLGRMKGRVMGWFGK